MHTLTARTRPAAPRRGLATLEFVLVWPLLLMLASGLFLVARGVIAKEAAATRARNDGWLKRAGADSGGTFRAVTDPGASTADGRRRVPVAAGPLFQGTGFAADSRSFVVGNEWDGRDGDAQFTGVGPFQPHMDIIGRLLAGGGFAQPGGLAALLGGGLAPGNVGGATVGDALGSIGAIKFAAGLAAGGLKVIRTAAEIAKQASVTIFGRRKWQRRIDQINDAIDLLSAVSGGVSGS